MHNTEPAFSNDDFLRPSLINEELSESSTFYYRKVGDIDSIACGDLLLRNRHLLQKRLDRLYVDRIYTTGPRRKMRIDIILRSSFIGSAGGEVSRGISWRGFLFACVVAYNVSKKSGSIL